MSLTDTGMHRNVLWTRQLREGETRRLRSEAREMRDIASWYRARAFEAEKRAQACDAEADRYERECAA